MANPQQLFYAGQKVRMRANRVLEGLERAIGVRGGAGLQVDLRGVQDLTGAVSRAGRRIRRALHQKPGRGGDRGQVPAGPSGAAGITSE